MTSIQSRMIYENNLMNNGHQFIAGIDEVGVGPIAGPIVAATVILDPNKYSQLFIEIPKHGNAKKIYVNDSKQLSFTERMQLEPIIRNAALAIGIGIVNVTLINNIKNINKASGLARFMSLLMLRKTVDSQSIKEKELRPGVILCVPDVIMIDHYKMPELSAYAMYENMQVMSITQGDEKSISIGAASVIAKVYRDRYMCQLSYQYPQYGWQTNAGYGTPKHFKAIEAYGLTPHHREYFIPEKYKKLKKVKSQAASVIDHELSVIGLLN